ncbi:hypothetical protein [Mesorhizobium sp.]|uniref:hypothetical protein n=1 Tax=Mesorhizobium sp. TaxID=1871066 RepID=UPI0025C627A6|nr:hypothetical protein [Mesorhizobium sp.]
MNRVVDRLLAVILLLLAVVCCWRAWLALGDAAIIWRDVSSFTGNAASLQLAGLLAVALACLLGAGLFWAGLLPGRASHAAGAPLFGRADPIDWTAGFDLQRMNERRAAYIAALKAADQHDIGPLLTFVGLPRLS